MTRSRSNDGADIARARNADILEVAARAGALLKRITATEWAGPCPVCGGNDTFAVNAVRRLFVCRRGEAGGDVIAMTMHASGLDFVGALEFLTGEERREPVAAVPSLPRVDDNDEQRRIARAIAIFLEAVDPRETIVEIYWKDEHLNLTTHWLATS
jgi:hypothetical protein